MVIIYNWPWCLSTLKHLLAPKMIKQIPTECHHPPASGKWQMTTQPCSVVLKVNYIWIEMKFVGIRSDDTATFVFELHHDQGLQWGHDEFLYKSRWECQINCHLSTIWPDELSHSFVTLKFCLCFFKNTRQQKVILRHGWNILLLEMLGIQKRLFFWFCLIRSPRGSRPKKIRNDERCDRLVLWTSFGHNVLNLRKLMWEIEGTWNLCRVFSNLPYHESSHLALLIDHLQDVFS